MTMMETVRKPAERPVIVTLCGDSGMGKTSLAAAFPKPIFIRAEDGMQSIPENLRPDAFPVVTNSKMLWEQITAVIHEPHDYQTLVIDSVTALERMFTGKRTRRSILARKKKPSNPNPKSRPNSLKRRPQGCASSSSTSARVPDAMKQRFACSRKNSLSAQPRRLSSLMTWMLAF